MTVKRAGGVFFALCVLGTTVLVCLAITGHQPSHLKEKVISFNGKPLHCITDQGHIATCDWVRYHGN